MAGIDTSIYGNIQPVQTPSILDSASKAATLSELSMRQRAMNYELGAQMATRQAYMNNTDPQTGQVDTQGVISSLAKSGYGQQAQALQSQIAQQQKEMADAQTAKMQAAHATVSVVAPTLNDLMNNIPEDQRPIVWQNYRNDLINKGVKPDQLPQDYDTPTFQQHQRVANNIKEQLDNFLTQANIGKTQAETQKALAEAGNVQINRNTDYQKMLLGDEQYKKALGSIAQGQNALAAVDDAVQNPQSRANLPLMLARFTSQGQRMNEQEIERNIKSGTFGDQLKQMYTDAQSGVLTPKMADYARQFLTSQMQSSAKVKAGIENDYAAKYAVAAGIPFDAAYTKLTAHNPGTVTATPSGPARFSKNSKANNNSAGSGGIPGIENTASASSGQDSAYRQKGAAISADELAKYATKHKMKLDAAKQYLGSWGYVIGR